jgi:acyl-CoA thioesterase
MTPVTTGYDKRHMTDDIAWLGVEPRADGTWSLELNSHLGRGDGKLYGGTGLALAVALMETVTDREALWATVQFSGSANVGERLDCTVDVHAQGRRSSQLQVTVRAGDRLVFTALGATGAHAESTQEVQVPVMPDVPGPEAADDWVGRMRLPNQARSGWTEIADMRRFELPDGHFGMWGRLKGHPQSRASLGFLADFVPVSVSRAARVDGAGFSLDNSIRFGYFVETDWVLLDFDPWFAAGSYLHGAVRLFAEDGTLLGVASQTASGFVR